MAGINRSLLVDNLRRLVPQAAPSSLPNLPPAAPLPTDCNIVSKFRPALYPKSRLSQMPIIVPAIMIWLHNLAFWPLPGPP